MNPNKYLRNLAIALLALWSAGTPVAIRAADQPEQSVMQEYFLPIVTNGSAGGTSSTLENGGTVAGPDGVGIGALDDTLDAPIQVSIAATASPGTVVPAPAQVVGGFYQIAAGDNVFVPTESPLLLAFPVPAGADSDHLALAVLQAGGWISDIDESLAAWSFLEGMVDPGRGQFLTTVAGLKQDGDIYTLVEHPDFESPPNIGSPATVTRTPQFDQFTAHCLNFINPTDCTAAIENVVGGFLSDVYAHIQTVHDFKDPRLRYMDETLAFDPHSYNYLGYTVYLEPYNYGYCVGHGGYYEPMSGRLVLCYNPTQGITSNSLYILVHEFFHATQYAYLETLADYADRSEEKWVIEGMATSAMKSYSTNEMLRTDLFGGLHAVDIPLEYSGGDSDLDEYLAQDFWVYYGQRNGLGLSYLESILEQGATSQAVVDVLGGGEFLDDYWNWVKNHVMEPEIDYEGVLGTPCELEPQAVFLPEDFNFEAGVNVTYPVVVDPLSSLVIKINWDKEYDFATAAVSLGIGEPPEADLALRYKFYVDGEPNCETVPDRYRTFLDIDPAEDYYAVISNVDHDNSYSYLLRIFEYYPTLLSEP